MPLGAGAGPTPPLGARGGPQTTGRFLVLMEPGGVQAGVSALTKRASLRLASAADFLNEPAGTLAVGDSEGIVFEDLGVAVVNAPPDQAAAVSSVVSQDAALVTMEAERVVYALGGMDLSYVRGFRDGVNQLADQILKGGEARAGLAAAGFEEAALTWGLQALGVDRTRFTGRGIKVAVLDTGLDFNHPDFLNHPGVNRAQSRSFVAEAPTAQDGHGHGTHCVGIVAGPAQPSQQPRYGVAPDAEIYVGKVLDDSGRGIDGDILAGLQWAITSGCDLVSMSLGAPVAKGQAPSRVFEQAASRALDRGCLIMAAAGNDSRRPQLVAPVSHPANCRSILAVAAVDRALQVAWFSNGSINKDGGAVDIAGPGVDCKSAWPIPTQYKVESGTSMATPHVAGIAALIAEAEAGARGARLYMQLLQSRGGRSGGASDDVGVGIPQAPR